MGSRATLFLLLGLVLVQAAGDPSSSSLGGREEAEEKEPPVWNLRNKERVLLSFANALTLALSLSPFIIRLGFGSWFITREIFPAKVVACNYIASTTWTVYMTLQMYVGGNYAGQEALLVNCLTMGFNLATLLLYFINGREFKKFVMLTLVFILMGYGGMLWLVWHPDLIADQKKNILKKYTNVSGGLGIALFALSNIFPYADLWTLTNGDRNDFTLLNPILINAGLSCVTNFVWMFYAWIFTSQHPNYLMIANGTAGAMTCLQVIWVLILRFCHKVEGQITDVESLRSVFISVSNSLTRLATAPQQGALWKRKNHLIRFQESLKVGVHSLLVLDLTFRLLQAELQEKRHAATAAREDLEAAAGGNEAEAANATAEEAIINAALEQCASMLAACNLNRVSLQEVINAVNVRLAIAHGEAQDEGLQMAINKASIAMGMCADRLRPCMQIINASEGIPLTFGLAFDFCRVNIVSIKASANSWFLI